MAERNIVAIGTSAGGVRALRFLVSRLERDFPAVILVTIHLAPHFNSELDSILSNAGPLPASFARDGEEARQRRIYIAPPNHHLLIVDGGTLALGIGPRENHSRPAVDPMFRSAALCCGRRSIGVVLTGLLGDGASGIHALQEMGGITIVQDPADAEFPQMPVSALDRTNPDHVVPLEELAPLLRRLADLPEAQPRPAPAVLRYEVDIARQGHGSMSEMDKIGRRSVLTCPDCHGIMWEIDEGDLVRYRCHLGHAYSAEIMNIALDESVQRALRSGLRALEERAALTRRLHDRAAREGRTKSAASWAEQVEELERQASDIRDAIARLEGIAPVAQAPDPAVPAVLPRQHDRSRA